MMPNYFQEPPDESPDRSPGVIELVAELKRLVALLKQSLHVQEQLTGAWERIAQIRAETIAALEKSIR